MTVEVLSDLIRYIQVVGAICGSAALTHVVSYPHHDKALITSLPTKQTPFIVVAILPSFNIAHIQGGGLRGRFYIHSSSPQSREEPVPCSSWFLCEGNNIIACSITAIVTVAGEAWKHNLHAPEHGTV